MIFTASWFAHLPPTHRKIGVSRANPRGFELALTFPALHPGPWFRSVSPEKYRALYARVLEKLDPAAVVAELTGMANGKTPTLVCFESARDIEDGKKWCHRHLIAEWLEPALGDRVEEVGFPNLDRFAFVRSGPKQLDMFA